MESKAIVSSDGFIWMDVTDMALNVFESGLFVLHGVWQEGEATRYERIIELDDLKHAINKERRICIFVSKQSETQSLGPVTPESWNSADKITHEGHIYVRFKDILFCK